MTIKTIQGRPALPDTERRDANIHIQITQATKDTLRRIAAVRGITVSALCGEIIARWLTINKELKMEIINWTDLIVTDVEGNVVSHNLGALVNVSSDILDTAVITNGKITEWPEYFISAPGEDANCDTPHIAVNWTGFIDALNAARK